MTTRLTLSEAARCCGVARSTLQRAVRAGRLSLTPEHTVDIAELLRAGYTLHAAPDQHAAGTLQDAAGENGADAAPRDAAAAASVTREEILSQAIAHLQRECDLLRAALDAAAAREQHTLEREARLLNLLEQTQRLLQAPQAPEASAPPARSRRWHTLARALWGMARRPWGR